MRPVIDVRRAGVVLSALLVVSAMGLAVVADPPRAAADPPPPNVVTGSSSVLAPKLCSTGGSIGISGSNLNGVVVREAAAGPGSVGHMFTAYMYLPKSDGSPGNPAVSLTQAFTSAKPIRPGPGGGWPDGPPTVTYVLGGLQDGAREFPGPPGGDGIPQFTGNIVDLPGMPVTPGGTTSIGSTGNVGVSTAGWYRLTLYLGAYVDDPTGNDFTYTLSYNAMPTCDRDPLELACPCNPASGIVTNGTGWKEDPVATNFGTFAESKVDIDIPSRGGGLQVGRQYSSRLASQPIYGTSYGYGWTTSFGARLEVGASDITLRQPGGAPAKFSPVVGSSQYVGAPWVSAVLAPAAGGGYTVTYKDGAIDKFNPPVAGIATLASKTNRNGYVTLYNYTSGMVSKITDVDSGRHIDANWTASSVTFTDPASRTVTWNFSGNDLTDVVDVGTHHHKYGYTNQTINGTVYHTLTSLRAPKQADGTDTQHDVINHYDTYGRVDTQTDNRFTAPDVARVTVFAYTGGNATTSADSTVVTTRSGSATGTVLSQRTDTYVNGQRTQTVEGTGTDTTSRRFSYDPGTGGITKTEVFDKVSSAWVLESTATYDYAGNRTSAAAPIGNPVTFNYGTPGSANYAKFGLPTTVTDPAGVVTTNDYDNNGNLRSTCTPYRASLPAAGTTVACDGTAADQKTTYIYGAKAGDVTWIENPLHQVSCTDTTCTSTNASHLVYDANGYLQSQETVKVPQPDLSVAVNKTTFVYDNVGRLTSVTSPAGNASANPGNFTTTVTPDAYGATVGTSVPNPAGGAPIVTVRHFDANHNLDWGQPADGNCTSVPTVKCTTYTYNERDFRTLAHLPESGTDQITAYFPDGQLKSQTEGNGAVTSYTWDTAGRSKTITDNARVTSKTYDSFGRLATKTDPANTCGGAACVTTYNYDAASRLSGVAYSDGVTPNLTTFTYDTGNRRTSVTAGTVTTAHTWDTLGRMTSSGENAETLNYGYDIANNLTSIQYPGGNCGANPKVRCVSRGFDPSNRLVSVTDPTNAETKFTPDQDGNYVKSTFPGTGDIDTYVYDSLDRLMSSTIKSNNATVASMSYERSVTGLVTRTTETGLPIPSGDNNSQDVRYGYDANNRMCWRWANAASPGAATCASPPSGAATWSYDGAANLTKRGNGTSQKNDPSGQVCYSVVGATTNACASPPTNATAYPSDNNANRSAKTPPASSSQPSNYTYDQQHRLTQAKVPSQYGNAGEYTPIDPWRALDSRDSNNCTAGVNCGKIPAGGTFAVQVTGSNGVPVASQVGAVMFNLTIVASSVGNGYVTALPAAPTGVPATSNINYAAGQTLSNGVVTKTDANGKIYIYNSNPGTVDVIIDVNGWYGSWFGAAGGTFNAVNPARLYDSRSTQGNCNGTGGNLCTPIAAGATRTITVGGQPFAVNTGVPTSNVSAVTLNLTATGSTQSGTLIAYAGGATPSTTSVWFAPGATVGELNVVKVAAGGTISIKNTSASAVDVIIDVFGWTAANGSVNGTDYVSLNTPVRAYDSHCQGAGCGTIATGTPRTITITGANVPAGATAVTANVTAMEATTNGYLTVYPADVGTTPITSNVNYGVTSPQANGVTVKLPVTGNPAVDGKITIAAQGGSPNVIVDITGYYVKTQNTITYTYSADGNRVSKNTSIGPVSFIWDYAQGTPLLAATKYFGQYTYYTYGPGGAPLAQGDTTTASYFHHDQIGSTRLLTNATGGTVGSWTYDPYGNTTGTGGNANATPLRFNGQYFDADTGHYNLRARLYDPTTGQFLTRDPLATLTHSAYGYTGGNPISRSDPSGLAWGIPDWVPVVGGSCVAVGDSSYTQSSDGSTGTCDNSGNQNWAGNVYAGAGNAMTFGHGVDLAANLTGQGDNFTACFGNSDSWAYRGGVAGGILFSIAFGGADLADAGAFSVQTRSVTSWASGGATADINSGRWAMTGGETGWNFFKSGLWGPQWENGALAMRSGFSAASGEAQVIWPGLFKGLLGQRIIV